MHACTLKQSVRHVLKTNNVTCFSCFISVILTLFIIGKTNLQWSCLQAFSFHLLQQFKLEGPSTEKLNLSSSIECLECFDSMEF